VDDDDRMNDCLKEEAHYWHTILDMVELVESVGLVQVLQDVAHALKESEREFINLKARKR